MTEKSFMTVEEVAAELRVSKSKAYQIVRELNAEMQKQGYLTVAGRVNATFFHKKVCYSEQKGVDLDGCILLFGKLNDAFIVKLNVAFCVETTQMQQII